ncbi:hypothetical protein [Engelhardtia mirabilis]|uniref:Uncharacterized protein n=1 Tax=Engelhardtia mirabilis TaxID=2528011 RepID=A0A518BHF4_9BACT|nr:hypothetical protein Pla133_14550 [Planctomycetes bacterium Pla133]QDV00711.1 hypothetical protein Pla86_14540 [Planctomycetes bacterium Pla86]
MSASDDDDPPDAAELRMVRAALDGDEGARVVLAENLRVVPLEVARLTGGDGGDLLARVRAALAEVGRSLPNFTGDRPLETWALELTRRTVEPGLPAADPEALVEDLDVLELLEPVLPHHRSRRHGSGSLVDRFRRLRHLVHVVLFAALIAIFFWSDPLLEEETGGGEDDVRGGKVHALYPVGSVGAFDHFEWIGTDLDGYTATVIVLADDGRRLTSPQLEGPSWTPRPGLLESFGDRIRWEIVARIDGRVERGWAYAWRDVR